MLVSTTYRIIIGDPHRRNAEDGPRLQEIVPFRWLVIWSSIPSSSNVIDSGSPHLLRALFLRLRSMAANHQQRARQILDDLPRKGQEIPHLRHTVYNTLDGPPLLLSKHRHIWYLKGSHSYIKRLLDIWTRFWLMSRYF